MPLEGGQKPRERGIIWARAPCGSAQEQEGSTKGSPAQTQPAPLIRAQRTSKRHCSHSCLHIWGVLLPPVQPFQRSSCMCWRSLPRILCPCAQGHPLPPAPPRGDPLWDPGLPLSITSSVLLQHHPAPSLSTRLCTAAAHHTLAPARGHRGGPCPKSQMHPLCCLTRPWA